MRGSQDYSRRHCLLIGASGVAAAAFGAVRPAQSQIVRGTARILVGVPPGGPLDAAARLLAEHLKAYASAVIVETRPGAATRVALEAAKNGSADGSVMIMSPAAPVTLFPLDRAGEALAAVRDRRIDGRAVLRVRDG